MYYESNQHRVSSPKFAYALTESQDTYNFKTWFYNFDIVISHAQDVGRFALLAAPTDTEKAVEPPHKKNKRKHPPCSSSIIWTEVSSASDSDWVF